MNFPKTLNLAAIVFAKGMSLFAIGRAGTPCPPEHGQTTDALGLKDGGHGVPTLRRHQGLRAMTSSAVLSLIGCVLLSGQAYAQPTVLSVSPVSPFAFGSKVVGSTTSQVFTVTLVGAIPARITAITPAVAASRMTITGGTCAAGVTLGSPCTLAVSFNPIAAQAYSGFIKIDSTRNGTAAAPLNIDLSGTGIAAALPAITVTPAALNFGSIVAGTQSGLQSFTVRNSGTVNATVSALAATLSSPGAFIDVNETCTGSTLAPAQTCVVPVRFTPATTGSYSGTIRFYLSGSAAQAAQATVSGTATAPPLVPPVLAPQPLAFPGTATVGTAVPPRVLTLSNPNAQAITAAVSIGGAGFTQTNTCAATLAANASCTITVTFTPTVVGAASGSVTATTSAGNVSSALSGTAAAPLLPPTLSPSAINFGSIIIGQPSRPQTATLTNPNSVAITVSAITTTPGFAQTNTCGASLAAGGSCVISITFTAATVGNAAGSLTAATPQGSATSSLTGAGASVPLVPPQATPNVINFAAITVGTTSAAQTITVNNPNTQAITLGGFNANSAFVVSPGTCGPTLAASQSCTYTVVFKPNTVGATSAALTLSSNAGTDTVSASGSGTAPLQPPTLSPSAINFGAIVVGQPSRPQTLTLTNPNSTAMPVTALTVVNSGAGFAQTNTCGASLAGGTSCVITIIFTPSAVSNATGTVNVTTPQGNVSASLAGAGAQVALVPPQVTPATISFAATTVGATSAAQTITVNNPNTQAITLSGFNTSSANSTFAVSPGTCGATLAAAQSCTYTVLFKPTVVGTATGALTLSSSAGTETITASGVGLAVVPPPVIAPLTPLALSLSNWDFGPVTLGTQSSTRPFILQNTNAVSVSPLQITTSAGFTQSNTCGLTLAAGANCQINVQYTATNLGAATGTLSVSVAGSADTAALSATATLKSLGVTAAPVVAATGSVISATPRFMQASISAPTSQFITYSFTPGNPRVTVVDGIFCTTLTGPVPTTGATSAYPCAANSEFARHPTTATTFQTVQQNGSVVRATETIRIPSSVTRTAQNLGAATFYFVRRFDPQGFAVVEIRATGAIINAAIALNDVRLAFDTSQGPQPLVFVARNAALPPVTATLFYTGSGVLRGRWEIVLPGDVAPTERDLLPEASLPRSERGTQRRYLLLQRFEQLLPGNGRTELKLPSINPVLGATVFDGQYQLLLRIEAEPSIYGGESGAANFAMPLLRYFVGSITAPAARIAPITATVNFNGARPTFNWSPVPQARYYRLEVADRNNTVTYSAIVRDTERSYSALSGFTAASGSQWRVQALDEALQPVGESAWRAMLVQ